MSVQPIVMTFGGFQPASLLQLEKATRLTQNASLKFERMTGYYPRPKTALPIATSQTLDTGNVSNLPSLYAKAMQALVEDGLDPSEDLYIVYILQGRPLGQDTDRSGLGNPVWTDEMYRTGKWGWEDRANPNAGGVAVVGEGILRLVPAQKRLYYGEGDRFDYHRALQTVCHELAHAMGVPHSGYEPADHPSPMGDPWKESYKRTTIMSYSYGPEWRWIQGKMSTVGLTSEEIDTIRVSVHTQPSSSDVVRVYPGDLDRAEAFGTTRVRLSPGLLYEEYS